MFFEFHFTSNAHRNWKFTIFSDDLPGKEGQSIFHLLAQAVMAATALTFNHTKIAVLRHGF
jgi:hypothetical protein